MMRLPNEGLKELGVGEKGTLLNNDLKSWKNNHQFFTQAILSPNLLMKLSIRQTIFSMN